MSDRPRVILSGFADEAADRKTVVEQFAAMAALGLEYYSIRFLDVGRGIKNVLKLTLPEIRKVRQLQNEFGMDVSSLGSPIGKVKLLDVEDGTKNAYLPMKKYLAGDVRTACEMAHAFETKLIRGFSFYPPRGSDPKDHLPQAVDRLGQIAEMCHRSDLTFGMEVEANLVGGNGYLAAEIHRQVNHPAMVLVFDAANILVQGCGPGKVLAQYLAMKPGLGWMHIKDYRNPQPMEPRGHVNEDALAKFVPADSGDGAYDAILRDFARTLPVLEKKLGRRGIPGVFLDLGPHLKGGGQFGGFSGPDGMGVALRGLLRVLDYVGIDYHLRDFDDIRAAQACDVARDGNPPLAQRDHGRVALATPVFPVGGVWPVPRPKHWHSQCTQRPSPNVITAVWHWLRQCSRFAASGRCRPEHWRSQHPVAAFGSLRQSSSTGVLALPPGVAPVGWKYLPTSALPCHGASGNGPRFHRSFLEPRLIVHIFWKLHEKIPKNPR